MHVGQMPSIEGFFSILVLSMLCFARYLWQADHKSEWTAIVCPQAYLLSDGVHDAEEGTRQCSIILENMESTLNAVVDYPASTIL